MNGQTKNIKWIVFGKWWYTIKGAIWLKLYVFVSEHRMDYHGAGACPP